MEGINEEISSLKNEYKWILKEEVKCVLSELQAILSEACKRFPVSINPGENQKVKTEKYILSSSAGSQQLKCVLTLLGETICEADVTYKLAKQTSPHFAKISPDAPWRLAQIQDARNYLCKALSSIEDHHGDGVFSSGQEVLHLLKCVTDCLNRGRSSLAMPRRKTLEELVSNPQLKGVKPKLPNDVVFSFFVQAQKVVLGLYQLGLNSNQKVDLTSRHLAECSVPWLNDILVFFTLALQLCQQLEDKLTVFLQYEAELETKLLTSPITGTEAEPSFIDFPPTDDSKTPSSNNLHVANGPDSSEAAASTHSLKKNPKQHDLLVNIY